MNKQGNLMTLKSKIGDSLIGFIGGHIIILFVIGGLLFFINGFRFPDVAPIYLILLIPYVLGTYVYAGLFNHDIIIDDTKVQIVNSVPFFRRKISFDYSTIRTITMRHDWTETFGEKIKSERLQYFLVETAMLVFPYNYKWIKIETDKEYTFYCFGVDHGDYEYDGPTFEDLYRTLRRRHKFVKWTNDTHHYYAGLVRRTEDEYLQEGT